MALTLLCSVLLESLLENHLTSLSGFFGVSIIITITPFLPELRLFSPSRTSWHFCEVYYSAVFEVCGILFALQTVRQNPTSGSLGSLRVTSAEGVPSVLGQRLDPGDCWDWKGKSEATLTFRLMFELCK